MGTSGGIIARRKSNVVTMRSETGNDCQKALSGVSHTHTYVSHKEKLKVVKRQIVNTSRDHVDGDH